LRRIFIRKFITLLTKTLWCTGNQTNIMTKKQLKRHYKIIFLNRLGKSFILTKPFDSENDARKWVYKKYDGKVLSVKFVGWK